VTLNNETRNNLIAFNKGGGFVGVPASEVPLGRPEYR
jgi:hypothetical protein